MAIDSPVAHRECAARIGWGNMRSVARILDCSGDGESAATCNHDGKYESDRIGQASDVVCDRHFVHHGNRIWIDSVFESVAT